MADNRFRAAHSLSRFIFTFMLMALVSACGGGGGSSPSASQQSTQFTSGNDSQSSIEPLLDNVIPIRVGLGISLAGQLYPNQSFVSIQICEVSSAKCSTIDNVLIDTGSFGLRIFDSALTHLQLETSNFQGRSLYHCAVFASGYTVGRVATADLMLGTLKAQSLPIQIIDSDTGVVPYPCSQSGGQAITLPVQMGGNGILGVGPLAQDSELLKSYYYVHQGAHAAIVNVPNSFRIPQPVGRLNKHSNGLILDYPAVALAGAMSMDAKMILGLDTASNNRTQGVTFLNVNQAGRLKVAFNGQSYDGVIDSGANHYVFPRPVNDRCPNMEFFCMDSPQDHSVLISSFSGTSIRAITLTITGANYYYDWAVQPGLSGYVQGNSEFILGLPFFYGRKTFMAIQGQPSAAATNPAVGILP